MVHYNYILETQPNRAGTGWHFRVKIFRFYPYYVFEDGPHWSFILADQRGAKIEIVIYQGEVNNFSGLEKNEVKLIEISGVRVVRADPDFCPTKSHHRLEVTEDTEIELIDPLDSKHYMMNKLKCVAYGKYAVDFWPEYLKTKGPEKIVVLKMWRSVWTRSEPDEKWVKTMEGLSDYRFNPRIQEVQDLRFQLEAADTDVAGRSAVVHI